MGTQYKSLLGLTEVIADSAEISNIDLEATNITGLTTSRIPEGHNLYYTDVRVSNNPNVSSNTTHRERKDNPHGVTAAQVGIHTTNDIIEGHINLYYTDIRFDDRLATKTTTSLAEGSNLYYTDARFDTRFGIKTTTDLTEGTNLYYTTTRANADFDTRLASKTTTNLTEGTNLYYTDARFDTRFGIKTTTDLTEGTNLYYTDARFDTRLATKSTTNLTEGANLYYTDVRFDNRLLSKTTDNLTEGANLYYTTTRANADFDTRFGIKTTDDLTEGKNNIYYTEARVSVNADVKANTAYRNTGHLPLSGGTLTGNLNMGNRDIDNVNQIFVDRKGLANNKLVLYDGGSGSTTTFYGLGIQNSTLLYNVDGSGANHRFYYGGTNEVFRIGNAGVYSYRNLSVTGNISLSGTVDGVDVAALNTTVNNHIANTNNPHAVLATQIADFDTEVSSNTDVKANTAYRNTGHLPLAGGTLTGNLNMGNNKIITLAAPIADADAANKKYIDDKFRLYEEGKVLAERYSITTYANNTAEMDARFNGKTPNASQYLTNLYTVGWSGEQFGVIYNCYLYVPTDGNVTFRVRSDDSSDWFIDNALVASNYGGHGVGGEPVVTSTVFMTAGFHKSFSRFIEQSGGEGIIHDWDLKGGTNFTNIPTANIFIPGVNNLFDTANITTGTIITTSERADIKNNSEYTAIGHLPLDGGTLNGDLSINGELNIGGEKITRGATNGLQLYGPSSDIGGPHIQAFVSTDDYPVFQQLNNSHGSIAMCFDAYADGFTWKSSSSGTNAIIYKSNTDLEFSYSSGVAAGGEVTWDAGFSMDLANGLVSFSNGVDVIGDLTISGTVDGVDLKALNTDVKANTAYRNTGHLPLSGGTLTGNLNMGNQDIDNINQIFIDRNGAANNKIVLYDGGTPSTTNFYGFGIQSATLLYNVDSSAGNHKFYYGGTNELFRIGNAAVYSYRDLDVKGNITVSGTVDGVDVAALKSAVDTNTAKVSASGSINTHSDVNITTPTDGHVLTYTSGEWKNIPPAAADGYLPLSGGTMTGDLKLEVSRPTGGWASYFKYTGGTVNGRTYGFLLDANSFYLTAHNDDYSYSHPIMRFDHDGYCYAMKNFSAGTYKVVDVGAPTGPLDATNKTYVDNAVGGRLSLNGGTMRGNIDMGGYNINTVGTVDGYNLDTLNTNINSKLPLTGGTMTGNIDMGGYNINTVGTVDGYNLDTLNANINSKLPLTGGVITNGSINIYTQGRSGSHGAVKGLYVTSDFGEVSSGVEFRHSNGTQGTGIGYAGIYACGSNGSQNLSIIPKGVSGDCYIRSNGGSSIKLGKRKAVTGEPMISLRRNGDVGEGCLGYGGSLYAWVTIDQENRPVKGYTYLTKESGVWVNASDRRLKTDIIDLNVEDCCAKISLLKPRNYRWKRDEEKTNNMGFIADEVKQVYPDLVSNSGITIEGDENLEGINYTGMIPILVGAIQSMMGKMNELKNRIEILEKPII